MELIMDPIFGIVYAPFVVMLVALSDIVKARLDSAFPNLKNFTWYPFGVTVVSGLILTIAYALVTEEGANPDFMRNIYFTFASSVLLYDSIVGPIKKAFKKEDDE